LSPPNLSQHVARLSDRVLRSVQKKSNRKYADLRCCFSFIENQASSQVI